MDIIRNLQQLINSIETLISNLMLIGVGLTLLSVVFIVSGIVSHLLLRKDLKEIKMLLKQLRE